MRNRLGRHDPDAFVRSEQLFEYVVRPAIEELNRGQNTVLANITRKLCSDPGLVELDKVVSKAHS
jgi:hypothetical protein